MYMSIKEEEKILNIVKEIEDFCLKYGYFPRQYSIRNTPEKELSNYLACYLSTNHYHSNRYNFNFKNIKTKEGIEVEKIIDDLFAKYGYNTKNLKLIQLKLL